MHDTNPPAPAVRQSGAESAPYDPAVGPPLTNEQLIRYVRMVAYKMGISDRKLITSRIPEVADFMYTEEADDVESIGERLERKGLAGCFDSGVPDLATNPKYRSDYDPDS